MVFYLKRFNIKGYFIDAHLRVKPDYEFCKYLVKKLGLNIERQLDFMTRIYGLTIITEDKWFHPEEPLNYAFFKEQETRNAKIIHSALNKPLTFEELLTKTSINENILLFKIDELIEAGFVKKTINEKFINQTPRTYILEQIIKLETRELDTIHLPFEL